MMMMRPMVFLVAMAASAWADEVRLIGGGVVRGRVLEEKAGKVWVEMTYGKVGLDAKKVASIDRDHHAVIEEYYRALEEAEKKDTADAYCALAGWCVGNRCSRFVKDLETRTFERDGSHSCDVCPKVKLALAQAEARKLVELAKKAAAKAKKQKKAKLSAKPPQLKKQEVLRLGITPVPDRYRPQGGVTIFEDYRYFESTYCSCCVLPFHLCRRRVVGVWPIPNVVPPSPAVTSTASTPQTTPRRLIRSTPRPVQRQLMPPRPGTQTRRIIPPRPQPQQRQLRPR